LIVQIEPYKIKELNQGSRNFCYMSTKFTNPHNMEDEIPFKWNMEGKKNQHENKWSYFGYLSLICKKSSNYLNAFIVNYIIGTKP